MWWPRSSSLRFERTKATEKNSSKKAKSASKSPPSIAPPIEYHSTAVIERPQPLRGFRNGLYI
jgi:hypothetical protein